MLMLGEHVDLRPQHMLAVLVLPVAHRAEELQVLIRAAVAPRRLLARHGERAARRGHLLRALAVDISEAPVDQRFGELVKLVEIIGGVEVFLAPVEAEPLHAILDRVDILLLLLLGVGVIEAQVAVAAVLGGDAEIEADRLDVTEVQIAVRLGRKARADPRIKPRGQVGLDDLADEIAGGGRLGGARRVAHRDRDYRTDAAGDFGVLWRH
jgi:hypothetical protein